MTFQFVALFITSYHFMFTSVAEKAIRSTILAFMWEWLFSTVISFNIAVKLVKRFHYLIFSSLFSHLKLYWTDIFSYEILYHFRVLMNSWKKKITGESHGPKRNRDCFWADDFCWIVLMVRTIFFFLIFMLVFFLPCFLFKIYS